MRKPAPIPREAMQNARAVQCDHRFCGEAGCALQSPLPSTFPLPSFQTLRNRERTERMRSLMADMQNRANGIAYVEWSEQNGNCHDLGWIPFMDHEEAWKKFERLANEATAEL